MYRFHSCQHSVKVDMLRFFSFARFAKCLSMANVQFTELLKSRVAKPFESLRVFTTCLNDRISNARHCTSNLKQ